MGRTDHEKTRLRIFGFNGIMACGTDAVRWEIQFADTNFGSGRDETECLNRIKKTLTIRSTGEDP